MTIDKLKEQFLFIAVSLLLLFMDLRFKWSSEINMEKLVDKAVDYSSISFGFLLTVLAILLQTQTKAISAIKHAGRFGDLIQANKKGVVASIILVFMSIGYLSIKNESNIAMPLFCELSALNIINSFYLAVFLYQFVEVILFLEIFYLAIKE